MAWKAPKVREPLDEAALHDYALGALGRRMRTVAELRRLMKTRVEKGETGEARVEAVLERLRGQRYLDDASFAADYTRLRQEGAKFGRRRVQQDLQRKGVDGEVVATALDQAYEHVDETVLARQFLERKRMRKPGNEKESARVMRRLLAAGFSLQTVYKVLRGWEVGDAVLSAVESAEAEDLDAPEEIASHAHEEGPESGEVD